MHAHMPAARGPLEERRKPQSRTTPTPRVMGLSAPRSGDGGATQGNTSQGSIIDGGVGLTSHVLDMCAAGKNIV